MKNMQSQKTILKTENWKLQFIEDGFYDLNLNFTNKFKNNDEKNNRFKIKVSFLLINSPHGAYLVDLGIGSYPNHIFIRSSPDNYYSMVQKLSQFGLINLKGIMFSHLHIDHMGGYLEFKENIYTPNFPGVPCYVNRQEWEFRLKRLPESDDPYKVYIEQIRPYVYLTETGDEVLPGIKIFCTGGHTPGHQTFLIMADNSPVFYSGDLIATETQLAKNRSLPYDFDPEESSRLRRNIYEEARKKNWIFALNHSPHTKFSMLDKNKKK